MHVDAKPLQRDSRVRIGLLAARLVDLVAQAGGEAADERGEDDAEDRHGDDQLHDGEAVRAP